MKKILYLLKEMFFLIKKQKIYFLAPLMILLAVLAILVFYLGPSVIISFIYAGI
ncbi:MAG: DUF5989 family protein [Candidatus Omnitrophica bacterium]|nr:DUF5989 family protein [Candidatus Omnitrophota bacterium]